MWPCDDAVPCDDWFVTSLTVQRGGADHTAFDAGCGSKPTLAAQAIELVRQAVGKDACG